jgi:hypothetical protein
MPIAKHADSLSLARHRSRPGPLCAEKVTSRGQRVVEQMPSGHAHPMRAESCAAGVTQSHQSERKNMNQIIYIVGLVVIVIAILSFFGLR